VSLELWAQDTEELVDEVKPTPDGIFLACVVCERTFSVPVHLLVENKQFCDNHKVWVFVRNTRKCAHGFNCELMQGIVAGLYAAIGMYFSFI
jgi:hypothetical protein